MKFRSCLLTGLLFVFAGMVSAQTTNYRVSSPHTYKNLTIFLLHGKDQNTRGNVMTLQEAMERKLFVVYETSEVNALEVENLSKTFDVFIQSGDIVKGGKQDRVLAVSIIIPASSGRVKIDAFCVESGRWKKRGSEDSTKFTSSNDRIVTKELKIATNAGRSQSEVWKQVSEAQARLSKNVGGEVKAASSQTSLQLSLEDGKVVSSVRDYVRKLSGIVNGKSDVIGYAVAINGRISSADVYGSNALFRKVWIKMLKASATEAVSESRSVRLADPVRAESIKGFLDDSEKAASRAPKVSAEGASITTREDKDNAMTEARDEKSKVVVHRTYVKKN